MTTLTVGSDQQYASLAAAVAAAQPGDTIDVQAGTYTFASAADFPATINSLTIQGVGGIATFVATAQPPNGKALLDVAGTTTLANLDISGVTVPDANGAAVRYENGTLLIKNTAIHDNQDGILGADDPNGSITIDGSEFYDGGIGGNGHTHNIYVGRIGSFTLTNSYIHDANVGHEVKSRAAVNDIENNRLDDNGSTASYEIDLPNGGAATISNNTIQKSANSQNPSAISFGEEGIAYGNNSLFITGNTLVSDRSNATIIQDASGTDVAASGNSQYGFARVGADGHVSASGFTTLSSRPTLDTSSPINRSGSGTSSGSTTPSGGSTGSSGGTTPSGGTASGDTTPSGGSTGSSDGTGSSGGTTPSGGTASGDTASGDTGSSGGGAATGTPAADTTPPTLTASQSISGVTTSAGTVLSGTADDAGSGVAAVEIFVNTDGTSTDIGPATLNGNTWSYTVSNLSPGTYTFYAVGFDRAGNSTAPLQTGPSETVTAPAPAQPSPPTPPAPPAPPAADTTPPVLTVAQNIAGTTTSTSTVLSGTVDDAGSGVAGVEISVATASGTIDLGAATLNGSAWSYTVSNLSPGTYTFYATATDQAGNSTPATQTGASETVVTPTGFSLAGATVSNNAVIAFGTAPAGGVVTLTDTIGIGQTSTIGTATAGSDGSWFILSQTVSPDIIHQMVLTEGDQSSGLLALASTANDLLIGTMGVPDLFLFGADTGNDVLVGFAPTAAAGDAHDAIELVGTGYQSFDQLQPHISGTGSAVIQLDAKNSITLLGVSAATLGSADFRFA